MTEAPHEEVGRSQELADLAMQWIFRLREPAVADSVILEWLAWYEADAEHRRTFDQVQEFWQFSGNLASTDQRMRRVEALLRRPGLAQWWHAVRRRFDGTGSASEGLRSKSVVPIAALAACLLGAVALVWYHMPSPSTTDANQRGNQLADRLTIPLVRTSRLPDGSSIELAPQTTVDVDYTPTERLLSMQGGEAHFTVAPNKVRPFIVRVKALQVRAVGTQFDIRQAGDSVVVKVIEGKIDIYESDHPDTLGNQTAASTNSNITRVVAGQKYISRGSADGRLLTATNSNESLAWREGRLQYVSEPLNSVIDDVNRYISRPIVIRDDNLKALTYTGTIFAQSIDEWLDAIPKEFPLVVITEADRIILAAAPDRG